MGGAAGPSACGSALHGSRRWHAERAGGPRRRRIAWQVLQPGTKQSVGNKAPRVVSQLRIQVSSVLRTGHSLSLLERSDDAKGSDVTNYTRNWNNNIECSNSQSSILHIDLDSCYVDLKLTGKSVCMQLWPPESLFPIGIWPGGQGQT